MCIRDSHQVMVVERVGGEKKACAIADIDLTVVDMLNAMHKQLLENARKRLSTLVAKENKLAVFGPKLDADNGVFHTSWCGSKECENKVKEYKGSIRCILEGKAFGTCFNCDAKAVHDVLVAKAY